MEINLKRLSLLNFKGIRSRTIDFDKVTNIFGDNEEGKTSLLDAYLWLLFDKDSSDRSDFEIKTIDKDGNYYHELSHEVSAVLDIDGEEIKLRKVYAENWVTKRGTSDRELKGHVTNYFWNEVPLSQKDYTAKINSLINETQFKLLSNVTYFNSAKVKWEDRRNSLISLVGGISDIDIANELNTNGGFKDLVAALLAKKSVKEFKDQIGAQKKKIKDELDLFQPRIDEVKRGLPEEKNYSLIEKGIADSQNVLATVEDLLMNKSKAQKAHQDNISTLLNEKNGYNHQLMTIEFDAKNSVKDKRQQREQVIQDKKRELNAKRDDKSRLTSDYLTEERRKKTLESQKADLVAKWEAINKETLVFNDNEFSCPACKRAYESSNIEAKQEELRNNFNTDKSNRLTDVSERGHKLADEIKIISANLENIASKGQVLNNEMEFLQKDISILEEEHQRLSSNEALEIERTIATDPRHKELKDKIALLDEQINTPFKGVDNSEALSRKRDLIDKIDDLKKELATKDQRQKSLSRIKELEEQWSKSAQELATLEGIEFSIEQFTKAKMDMLEKKINGMFKIVSFKLFDQQINGGEKPTCITLINGVPYPDANTASKINAGLDIINTFSDFYGVKAPIFIDNRESVVRIPESDSQLINLIVTEGAELSVGKPKWKPEYRDRLANMETA